jgi:hypothetical protein
MEQKKWEEVAWELSLFLSFCGWHWGIVTKEVFNFSVVLV